MDLVAKRLKRAEPASVLKILEFNFFIVFLLIMNSSAYLSRHFCSESATGYRLDRTVLPMIRLKLRKNGRGFERSCINRESENFERGFLRKKICMERESIIEYIKLVKEIL